MALSCNICVSAFQGDIHQPLVSTILGTRHHTQAKCKNGARRWWTQWELYRKMGLWGKYCILCILFADSVCCLGFFSLVWFGLVFLFFFLLNFCDAFCKFSIEILTPGSLETVFLKAMLELLIAKIWACSPNRDIFFLYQYFSLLVSIWDCIWRFINQLCFYKQTMFSQTPLLPSSLFQDLIEKFSPRGGKNSAVFDVLSPLAQETCSSCSFVTRSLSVPFTFLGSNPFSAAVFRSALPVLSSEYPANKAGSEGEVRLCFRTPWITHLTPSSLFHCPSFHYSLSIFQAWTFTSPLCVLPSPVIWVCNCSISAATKAVLR